MSTNNKGVTVYFAPAIFLLVSTVPTVADSITQSALRTLRWSRIPLGRITPSGWLERQTRLQADALTSHLPYFWPQVANTSWLGGTSDNDGGLHESTPYWLNGAVPLAQVLNHTVLLQLTQSYISEILKRQASDGWLGPDTDQADFWSRYPFLLALVQAHEALPQGDPEADTLLAAVVKFLDAVAARLKAGVILKDWSAARAHDLIWVIHYVVDVLELQTGKKEADEPIHRLLDLAVQLRTDGFQWHTAWFGNQSAFPQDAVSCPEACNQWTHGVNNAQAVKHGAVWSRQAGGDAAAATAAEQSWFAWELLSRFHGQPHGAFAADEHLAGRFASRGTELCLVVESMWSLALTAQAALNDSMAVKSLDALEDLAFNALPGGLSDDLWSHPYLQFPNTFQARPGETDHIWSSSDGADAAMYGLAPNYECCTANFHQGYPKLITNLYFEEPTTNSLVSVLWAPSRMTTSSRIGGGVEVELRTDYPFSTSVEYYAVNPEAFTFRVRLPAFLREVEGPSAGLSTVKVWVEGHERLVELVDGFIAYELPAWPLPEPRCAIRIEWASPPYVKQSSDQGSSVFVGPLLLTPDLKEELKKVRQYEFGAADWDITTRQSWQMALPAMQAGQPSFFGPVSRQQPGALPYNHTTGGCPLRVNVSLLYLSADAWPAAHNAPTVVPKELSKTPVLPGVRSFLPYSCTSLHMAVLPSVPPQSEWVIL